MNARPTCRISGGQATIVDTVIGALILSVMVSGFTFLKVDAYYEDIIKGVIIIAAVVVDQYTQRKRSKA